MSVKRPLILFDGVCNLCNSTVRGVFEHDSEGRFRFATLQSAAARGELENVAGADEIGTLPDSIVLLDADEPRHVLKRACNPFLKPESDYETSGFFPHVVFCNGLVEFDDGTLFVYYGACDGVTCVAETSIDDLLQSLDE